MTTPAVPFYVVEVKTYRDALLTSPLARAVHDGPGDLLTALTAP